MPRRKKKQEISTRTAVILAGAAVCVVFLVCMLYVLRASRPARQRWEPPPVAMNADDAWRQIEGKWGSTVRTPNSVSKVEYEFTPDRRMIFLSSLSGGVLPKPQTNTFTKKIVSITLEDDDILLELQDEGGQPSGVMTLWLESPTILLIEDDEFKRID